MLQAEMSDAKSGFAAQITRYISQRQVPPIDLVVPFLALRLKKTDCRTKGWVLSDFPTTEDEAFALQQAGIVATHFLHLAHTSPEDISRVATDLRTAYADVKVPVLTSDQLPFSQTEFENRERAVCHAFHASLHKLDGGKPLNDLWSDIVSALRALPISQAPVAPKKVSHSLPANISL